MQIVSIRWFSFVMATVLVAVLAACNKSTDSGSTREPDTTTESKQIEIQCKVLSATSAVYASMIEILVDIEDQSDDPELSSAIDRLCGLLKDEMDQHKHLDCNTLVGTEVPRPPARCPGIGPE